MTQKERQERSRRAILQAALEEFGAAALDAVTMDSICANHGISKGMMYHYYANKDELFLACAADIFQALDGYLRREAGALAELPVIEAIKGYFLLRGSFFQGRPLEKHVFENAVPHPPKHPADPDLPPRPPPPAGRRPVLPPPPPPPPPPPATRPGVRPAARPTCPNGGGRTSPRWSRPPTTPSRPPTPPCGLGAAPRATRTTT